MITYLGYILLIINICCLFYTDFLYAQTSFLVSFTAASVCNIALSSHTIGIQPVFLSAGFWILSIAIKNIYRVNYKFIASQLKNYLIMGMVFLGICAISAIKHKIFVLNGGFVVNDTNVVYSPITQFVYLFFGFILAFCIAAYNNNLTRIKFTFKIIILSGCFVALWGVFQLLCYYLHIKYPFFIFNNSGSAYAIGYQGVLSNINMKRIASVAVEPSILGQFLIVPFSILLVTNLFRGKIWNYYIDYVALLLIAVVLILTASASAVISLAFVYFSITFYRFFLEKNLVKLLCRIGLVVVIVGFMLVIFDGFYNFVYYYIFNKLSTMSGISRVDSVVNSFAVFLHHPLIGYGWASVRSDDLAVNLLANAGLLGFVVFVSFFIYIIWGLHKSIVHAYFKRDSRYITFFASGFFALIATLFYNQLTGFSYVFPMFWLVTGVSMAILNIRKVSEI